MPISPASDAFNQIIAWENLLLAYQKAARGKRGRESAARFEHQLADQLLELQDELRSHRYRPGPYRSFPIHEPKRRLISAAPFRDRVVHHALCNIIEPWFERRFIADNYANRIGKGTHRRYCDDFALFSDGKRVLWRWKEAISERLAMLRLSVHRPAEIIPVSAGIPWLGFIVYPTHRRLKARNVHRFSRRLRHRWQAYCAGEISFAELDATVQGWINHARYGDTWGLRRRVLAQPLCRSGQGEAQAARRSR